MKRTELYIITSIVAPMKSGPTIRFSRDKLSMAQINCWTLSGGKDFYDLDVENSGLAKLKMMKSSMDADHLLLHSFTNNRSMS